MNDLENFREINSFEKKIILYSLSTISSKILQILYDLQNFLYILFKGNDSKNNYPVIFLIEKEQKEFVELLNDKNIVYSVGLYFGFFKRDNFYLSLEGAEFLHENEIFPEFQQLFLNKKGEKSFLYGNNILMNMIDKIPQKLKKKDIMLVLNNFNEIIGISQSQCDDKIIHTLKPKDIIATNLSDKGLYLRKTQ
jgi:ribosome biogenesis protein Nip4